MMQRPQEPQVPQHEESSCRRFSMTSGRKKLRFEGGETSDEEMIYWLLQAKMDTLTYSSLTFDEITLNSHVTMAILDLFQTYNRQGRTLDRFNLEFCDNESHLTNATDNVDYNKHSTVDTNFTAWIMSTATIMDGIKHLFFATDAIVDDTMQQFSMALRLNKSLQSIWLLIRLTETSAWALGEGLSYNETLDKLSLSGSNWDGVQTMKDEDDDGTIQDASTDAISVSTRSAPRSVISHGSEESASNSSSEKPAMVMARNLAKGLSKNGGLTVLDVSCCSLRDDVMAMLIQSLAGHPTLEELDLSRNKCDSKSMQALADVMKHPECKLTSLDLREQRKKRKRRRKRSHDGVAEEPNNNSNKESPLPISVLSVALGQCGKDHNYDHPLEVLKLSNNLLTDTLTLELIAALQGNFPALHHLDLQWNQITDQGLQGITQHLDDLPALTVLKLGGNDFGHKGKTLLNKLEDDDDSICTIDEDRLLQQHQQQQQQQQSNSNSKSTGVWGALFGGQPHLGNIREEESELN